jgi:hypothetical protein
MALQQVNSDGSVLIVPSSSVNITVATQPTGIATSGILALLGEADEGPAWNDSGESLSSLSFSPVDSDRVAAKFGSGRLVDAFRNIGQPSASPKVGGGPNRIILIKTNSSTKASSTTADSSGTFSAKRAGQPGNLIKYSISDNVSESAPTTDSFSYVPSSSSSALAARVNGGSRQTLSISANTTPTALAASITALSNLNAVGGINRSVLSGLSGQNISLTVVSGQVVDIALALGQVFATAPQVGDTARIPAGSVIEGGSAENVGWYLVTAVVNTTSTAKITATKITSGAPANVAATPISGTPDNDLIDYSYMRVDDMSGENRNILTGLVGQTATVTVASSSLTFTLASGQVFPSSPKIGDIVYIPSGSAYQGAGNANVGWYSVTSVSNTTSSAFLTASRLSNGNPVAVGSTAIVATSDVQDYRRDIDGVGKSLEIRDNSGTVSITTILKQLGVNSSVTWISSSSSPQLLVSGAEMQKSVRLVRSSTNSSETFNIGGNISLQVSYQPSSTSGTATLTILTSSGTRRLQTSVSGGPGVNLDIDLSTVPTINDLVNIINSNTGYSAQAFTATEGQRSTMVLDQVTAMGICTELGTKPGRIKSDLYDLTLGQSGFRNSVLITYSSASLAGLPESQSDTFLSGGAKGASTGLQFSNAIDALKSVRCNFVIPLVSQDASDDAADGLTDGSSTYQVDAVNQLVKSHVLAMSTPKIKRHRIAVVSKKDTFDNAKQSAQNMSSFRVAHTFEDVLGVGSDGNTKQFQPWLAAATAASFQAAAFSRTIFNKAINISGALQDAGDWHDENVTDVENALLAGLLPIVRQSNGQLVFASDQMTYGVDNNFVYNSMQAVYTSDLMALSLADSLQTAFVGEVTADVTPAAVIAFIKSKMIEFLNLKFTASTDKFPAGWKDITVNISVPSMFVKVVAILSSGIYFIPIDLVIEGVSSSAAA